MKVPFADLKLQYKALKPKMDSVIQDVIDNTAFVRGPYVKQFEQVYAQAYGVKHCISVANGTDAIYLSLRALEIGPGDEVITTACSWIATSETITQTGARVVFVDIEPDYYNIDVSKIEEKITEKTKAIIPVHLYGQPVDMEPLMALCEKYNLYMIEDCAQAHFAQYHGQYVGTFGNAGTFSFYPGKNLGAYGDAGAVVTNDDNVAEKVRMIANHGSLVKHQHETEGVNSRMDGLQAAVLSVKMEHIADWNTKRYEKAMLYNEKLKVCKQIVLPKIRKNCSHVFHLYVIRAQKRDELQAALKEKGVSTGRHYPSPLPFLKAYEYLNPKSEDFPVARDYQSQILSLPMFPELTKQEVDYVAQSILEFYE